MALVHPASNELLKWRLWFFFDKEWLVSWLRRVVVVVGGCIAEEVLKRIATSSSQPTEKAVIVCVHRWEGRARKNTTDVITRHKQDSYN